MGGRLAGVARQAPAHAGEGAARGGPSQLVPRHWSAPYDKPGDNGIRGGRSNVDVWVDELGVVAPHGELVLEFSKSMAVALDPPVPLEQLELLNDDKPAGETIGKESGWWQRWAIETLELVDNTDPRPNNLFGTFSRSPLDRNDEKGTVVPARPPNTELRLWSSRRFGQDGSLGGGGAEESPPVECTPCCSLALMAMGRGRLPNGWAYEWHDGGSKVRDRDNRFGVGMASKDSFRVFPPGNIDTFDVTLATYQPHLLRRSQSRGQLVRTVREVLSMLACLPLASRGHRDVVAFGHHRERLRGRLDLGSRARRRACQRVNLTHDCCSCFNEAITSRNTSRARKSGQLRTGT